MLLTIAYLSIAAAFALLVALSYVDMKDRILPNEMVLGFLTCGVVFHLSTFFEFMAPLHAAGGAVAGFASLYLVRKAAAYFYKQDALGLGDVKLMGAGGVWLGIDGIFLAMATGAFAGVLHGIAVAAYTSLHEKQPLRLNELQIPAGPGFACGLLFVGIWQLRDFLGL